MKPFVSVVIPAHNEEKYLASCLGALYEQDYGRDNFEVILVDNNSTDRTADIAKQFPFAQYYFKKEGPVGAVRNFGAGKAKGEYIAFLDGDCVAPSSWISKGLKLLQEHSLSACGGRSEVDPRGTWIEKFWLLGHRQESSKTLDLIGATFFITREHFDSVDGFDENVTSGEDTQITKDLRDAGFAVEINQDLNVIHLGNAKTAKEFLKRQAWHSENYLTKINSSLYDPTFILVTAFFLCLISAVVLLLVGSVKASASALVVAAIIPNVFSVKRIARSRSPKHNIINYPKVYTIDLLYLTGRIIGIARNARMLLKKKGGF